MELSEYLYQRVKEVPGLSIAFEHDMEHRSSLTSITYPEELKITDADARRAGVRIRVQGKNKMRIGIHYYNNRKDIDRLMDYLKKRLEEPRR